jgi:hypothetical protein
LIEICGIARLVSPVVDAIFPNIKDSSTMRRQPPADPGFQGVDAWTKPLLMAEMSKK